MRICIDADCSNLMNQFIFGIKDSMGRRVANPARAWGSGLAFAMKSRPGLTLQSTIPLL